jgi:hypothetical protein
MFLLIECPCLQKGNGAGFVKFSIIPSKFGRWRFCQIQHFPLKIWSMNLYFSSCKCDMKLAPICIYGLLILSATNRAYLLKEKLVFTRQSCVCVAPATNNFQEKNSKTIDVRLLRHLTSDSIFRSQVSPKHKSNYKSEQEIQSVKEGCKIRGLGVMLTMCLPPGCSHELHWEGGASPTQNQKF